MSNPRQVTMKDKLVWDGTHSSHPEFLVSVPHTETLIKIYKDTWSAVKYLFTY